MALLAWGAGIAPRLISQTDLDVAIPGLPPDWQGRRIAFVSDLQVGMWLANIGTARRMVTRLVDDPPSAVLLGGDFLYSTDPDPRRQVATAVALVRPLADAGIPTYAVGNHDVATGAAGVLQRALEDSGVQVLANESVPLAPGAEGGAALHVVGIAPHLFDADRPRAAVARVGDGPRIVFMHHPASFPALPAGSAPVAVAGHTHCGQVRVPFTRHWSLIAALEGLEVPMDGWARGYGQPGNRLYVSCGVGFSRVPIRLGARPELTI